MRQTIKELRLARGWTQQRLADEVNMTARRISHIEGKSAGTPEELKAIANALQCSIYDLLAKPSQPAGRPRVEGRELLEHFRIEATYDPSYGRPAKFTLPAARECFPCVMGELDYTMQRYPEWRRFLDVAPCQTSIETLDALLNLRHGALGLQAAPQAVGFDKWPVTERDSTRIVGHIPVPALGTRDWLMIPQVTVRTPRPYVMDGLVIVLRPRKVILNLEYDGRGHDPRWDAQRTSDIGLPTLRLSEADVLADIPLSERIRDFLR